MTDHQLLFAFASWLLLTALIYSITGWQKVLDCYRLWFTKEYWTNYNVIEAISWLAKAVIIVPGLIFGLQIWQLYFIALVTSMMLIWASNKKLLPTLVGFNTLWIWLSVMIIVQNVIGK